MSNVMCSLQVTVNWFQLQQAQVVSLPVNHQTLCENAKLYEPGQRYIEFVRNLPTDAPRLESHSFDSAVTPNPGCDIPMLLLKRGFMRFKSDLSNGLFIPDRNIY